MKHSISSGRILNHIYAANSVQSHSWRHILSPTSSVTIIVSVPKPFPGTTLSLCDITYLILTQAHPGTWIRNLLCERTLKYQQMYRVTFTLPTSALIHVFASSDSFKLLLKFALQSDGSATSPILSSSVSLSVSLFTFLPLCVSHQECHQPPLCLMSVNMAALLSACSLLLSQLFALTLDEFIKGKREGIGENSSKITRLCTIDYISLAGRVFVFKWRTKHGFACSAIN